MSTLSQKAKVISVIAGAAIGYLIIVFGLLGGIIWFVVWLLRALGVSI